MDRDRGKRRRSTLLVSTLVVALLVAVVALLPVPYVALSPGPTTDTLGSVDGKPLIEITGRKTYPARGHLNLTTVSVYGGPAQHLDLVTALRGWLDGATAVVPEEAVFPPGQTAQQVEQVNVAQMDASQEDATAAALKELDIQVEERVVVGSVVGGSPAEGKLEAGDAIFLVDGTPVEEPEQVRDLVVKHQPGEDVRFLVRRGTEQKSVTVTTAEAPEEPGRAVVGILPRLGYTFPFEVDIGLEDVGGPSAGLMFALGITEKLTEEDLTDGRFIAGTGTIDDTGAVGPIGGIQQKLHAARDAGATVFLVPADNCAQAVEGAPSGLRLVKVETLKVAVGALRALASGGQVPACAS